MSNKVAPEDVEGGDDENISELEKPPLPAWGHLVVLVSVALPSLLFTWAFSIMGMGDIVYAILVDYSNLWTITTGSAMLLFLLLFVLDSSFWTGIGVMIRRLLLLVAAIFLGLACLFGAKNYPWAPLLFSMLALPGCVKIARSLLLKRYSSWTFFRSLGRSLFFIAVLIGGVFVAWIMGAWTPESRIEAGWDEEWLNVWGGNVKRFWRMKLGCKEVYDCGGNREADLHWAMSNTTCLQDTECWTGAFLWWSFPFVVTLAMLLYSLVCAFLWRVLKSDKRSTGGQAAIKLFGASIVLFTGGIWVSTSIAATSLNMTRVIIMALFLFIMVTSMLVGSTLGWSNIRKSARNLKVTKKAGEMSETMKDYGRAFFFCFALPVLVLYFILSFLNQLTRKCFPFTKSPEGGGLFTEGTTKMIARWKEWNWGSVCSKMTFWGVFYMVLQVLVMKVVFLFFSWFNEVLSASQEPPAVMVIFFVVGVIMFTIPVVPGVPVYVTAGILIPASFMDAADRKNGTSWNQPGEPVPSSFWIGLLAACINVFFVKLAAVVMEQEGIGRFMGKKVGVRAAIGINNPSMQATRMILSQPGLSFPKCTILVGGPDWPTSVLTGILKLSCPQMLLGTLPIAFLVIPSTAAGGFLLIKSQSEVFASLSTVVTMFAMATQLAAFLGAVWVIDKYITEHRDELAALPIDEEVAKLDKANAAREQAWRIVTRWDTPGTPKWPHALISAASLILTCACFANAFLTCWMEFEISNSISSLPGGKVFGIIKGPGYLVIAGFLLAWILRYIFLKWAAGEAQRYVLAHPELADASTAHAAKTADEAAKDVAS